MLVKAHAKINWSLDLVGKREDGYHLLDMVMQSIDLHDTLTILPAPRLTLTADGAFPVPITENNLVLRAARALQDLSGVTLGAGIHLHKRIPIGAGLGGGSSDAASALIALSHLWGLKLTKKQLLTVGLRLGADIPYCLTGGLCRVQGIGEIITPLPGAACWHLILLQPCRGLSTAQVFAGVDNMERTPLPTDALITALQEKRLSTLGICMGNALQDVSIPLRPQMRTALTALLEHGARAAQMTGSGSVVFGVFPSAGAAQTAYNALRRRYRTCILSQTLV